MEESTPFKLNNSSDSFTAKSADIFGCLSVIEKKHEAHQKAQPEDGTQSVLKPDPEDEDTGRPQRSWRNRDQRQEFVRPYPPSRNRGNHGGHDFSGNRGYRGNRGRNRTPDYKANPDRWTKYSLEDVEGKDMTESSNTKAAFAFLEERRKLREMEEDPEAFISANVEETACSRGAITFVRKKKENSEVVEKKKDVVVDVFAEEEGEGSGEEKKEETTEEKVSFKSKKGKKRNIRIRHSDDEDDQNG